jgi:hypothetical protein
LCTKCQSQLHLIALIQTEDIAKEILTAMHLPAEIPALHPPRVSILTSREVRL